MARASWGAKSMHTLSWGGGQKPKSSKNFHTHQLTHFLKENCDLQLFS